MIEPSNHVRIVGITGGAGFIGSHLTRRLLQAGCQVRVIDNLSMSDLSRLSDCRQHTRLTFHQIDVRDQSALTKTLTGVDVIVHLAAFKIPRYGDALTTLLVNAQGAQNVFQIAAAQKIKVVFASTSDVYGKSADLPFHEEGNLTFGPSTVSRWTYAVSKLYTEQLAYAYHEAQELCFCGVRIFGCYGPGQHLGWWGGPQGLFITAALLGKPMEIHGDGNQTRTFLYIDDAVDGFVACINSREVTHQVINIGSVEEIAIVDLARLVHRLVVGTGEPPLSFVPYEQFGRYEDVRRRVPNLQLAQQLIGFTPQINLATGLSRTIEWQRAMKARTG